MVQVGSSRGVEAVVQKGSGYFIASGSAFTQQRRITACYFEATSIMRVGVEASMRVCGGASIDVVCYDRRIALHTCLGRSCM